MWALGIILYQLIAYNNHPFPSDNIKKAILDSEPALHLLPVTTPPFIKNTIRALLTKNPDNRPDSQTLLV